MKRIRNTAKWPTKLKNTGVKRDTTKWYEFHRDHGHNIVDYITLRLEVTELLKRGHLWDLLNDKGKTTFSNKDGLITLPPQDPTPEGHCHMIYGNSKVSKVSYSSAKRHTQTIVNLEA